MRQGFFAAEAGGPPLPLISMQANTKTTAVDPVCGIEISTTTAYRVTRNGETHCFCSNGCRQLFLRRPSEWMASDDALRVRTPTLSPATAPVVTTPRLRWRQGVTAPRETRWTDYAPLLVVVDIALLAACAKQLSAGGDWNAVTWLSDFTGYFLLTFAMLKFFDLTNFVEGFRKYDLLGRSSRLYAYLYPAFELALGLAFLAQWRLVGTSIATLALMLFSALGVARAAWEGLDVQCAAMGVALKAPVSRVVAIQQAALGGLAAALLWLS